MDILQQKTEIERAIVEELLQQVDAKTITLEESMPIVNYCLEKIKPLTTKEEITAFLTALSAEWPMFNKLLIIENAKEKEANKDEVVDEIVSLAKDGKLDEALSVAKTATNN